MKLNEKYNPESFVNFIQDFLPEDFNLKEEDIVINKDRYKEITKAKILGFCESLDLHVLEMDHTHDKDPRVAIATDAFKILADHWIHRALVIFKNNDSENYRFSYLTISLDLNDKNKVVKKYSNARRYSFYLGTNAKVKTPEQQLIKKGKVKDVDDLLNRFSVEVVNKQFYLEVAKFFDELVSIEDQNLILPGVSEIDINTRKSFAVRLIGRAMFCWFLKQKKSDNGQLVPDEILSSKVVSDNYYHNTLEPLFFGVLNTSIDARDIRTELFDKVPYLNGGLFNPQTDDYYELDRGTFASKYINTLKISDKWFKEFFELLETYNFTIDENTVFDQELSVDPEMLGKIFENLLAKKIDSETGKNEQKDTGSFYTPRQIVEYMVDQSLIEYFKTKTNIEDKKLTALVSYDLTDDTEYPLDLKEKEQIIDAVESLKILDPACGSGAYPIGALQKIVYILQQVDPDCTLWLEKKLKGVPDLYKQKIINEVRQNPFDYTRKLDVIKNSIFGVDIQPIAVDVSRLRCFLTLVVESEIDDSKPNRGIEPLPNLDFKFVCANTLIELPKSESNSLFEDHSGITELSKIMSEYFSCNSQRKNELRIKFTNAQKEILEKTVSAFGRNTGELTLKLTTWNPFSNHSNSWFDSEWMFGLQYKFDVVIGNPPYVSYYSKQSQQDNNTATELEYLIKNYDFIQNKKKNGRFNTLMFFIEKGNKLLKTNGVLSYIIDTNIHNNPAKDIRKYILEESKIIKIVNNLSGFENVASSQVILITTKTTEKDYEIEWIVSENQEFFLDFKGNVSLLKTDDEISFQKPNQTDIGLLLAKLSKNKNISDLIESSNIRTCITFTGKKEHFQVFSKEQDIDYPLLEGSSGVQFPYASTKYTSFVRYDLSLRDRLNEEYRNLAIKDKKRSPMVIGLADIEKFKSPKIFVRLSDSRLTATYSDEPVCADLSLYIITLPNLKNEWENVSLYLILGLINSSLMTFYFRNNGFIKNYGLKIGTPQIRLNDLRKMPVPDFSGKDNLTNQIKDLVENILLVKDRIVVDNELKEKMLKIDDLVMDLYELSEEEKTLVRNS